MLYSRASAGGAGHPAARRGAVEADHHKIWQTFADHFYLFRGTPSGVWLAHELYEVFGIKQKLTGATAQAIYDKLAEKLARPKYRRARYSSASTSRSCALPTGPAILSPITR